MDALAAPGNGTVIPDGGLADGAAASELAEEMAGASGVPAEGAEPDAEAPASGEGAAQLVRRPGQPREPPRPEELTIWIE